MKQRGRKAMGSLAPVAAIENIPRQPPPPELNDFESELWVKVVDTRPADWFNADTLPILRSYVRHCYHAAKIDHEMSKIIDSEFSSEVNGASVGVTFEALAKMRDRESKQITALARSMRLTHQSQVHPKTAATAARKGKVKRPWEG